jgi:diguanylate cyclase (GGDEF)-like protein
MMTRLYSIQSQLFLVSLISMTIIISGGLLSLYLSNQMLSATNLFVETTLPRIETAKSLEKTALDIMNRTRALSQATRQEDLNTAFQLLTALLNRLEMLTAKTSQEEAGADILALNWTSQAIRTQAQLVFQLGVQRIDLSQQAVIGMQQARKDLINLPTLEVGLPDSQPDIQWHDRIHSHIMDMLDKLNQLESAKTVQDIDVVETAYRQSRANFLARTPTADEPSPELPGDETLREIQVSLDQLYILQRRNLHIHNTINGFVEELNGQVSQLTALTTQHVNSVFSHFHESAQQVIEKEKLTLYLTMLLMACAIIFLLVLHRRIVVHGFGDRLSRISRAMASDPGETRTQELQLQGQDEIADMARALEVLLDKAEQLRDLAIMDPLTQVFNRRRFFELASMEASRATRKKSPTILLMMDLDHFKSINDTYGHAFGDKVLHETAQTCLNSIRTIDVFARYGGEEFVALMPEAGLHEGMVVAERIREAIASRPFITDNGLKVLITMSLGLVETDLSRETVEQALKNADLALYQAKAEGRNRVAVWRPQDGGKQTSPACRPTGALQLKKST